MADDALFSFDSRQLAALSTPRMTGAIARALGKAGATALRDMKSEASKRARVRKRIKVGAVNKALLLRRPRTSRHIDGMAFRIDVSGKPVALSAYPHRQGKLGVTVEVNKGKRTLVRGAFEVTLKSGHRAILRRQGKARLPVREQLGSRPVDALLHEGEAEGVQARGAASLAAAFERLLPAELGKVGG